MKYNFYAKALCALITCANMGLVASEITADKVINHIAQITNTNAQSIKNLNVGHAIELSKNSYKKEYQAILNAQAEPYLHNSLVSFYKECIGKKKVLSGVAKPMLENIYSHIYGTDIANAEIILTKKLNKKPLKQNKSPRDVNQSPLSDEKFEKDNIEMIKQIHEANKPQQVQSRKKCFPKTPVTEEELQKQQKEQDDLIASTHKANEAYKNEKNKSSKFGSYLKIGGITAATFIAIGLGYYWYKK